MKRKKQKWDFVGWATKYNVHCADGRTIMNDAFVDDDGKKVPLVWNHQHDGVDNVLGHALLKEIPGVGVRAYGVFDKTREGQAAKQRVVNGSLDQLSIFANKLQESAGNVYHGKIRELSLVLAGANEGALIDQVLAHGANGECTYSPDSGIIYSGEEISVLCHSSNYNEEESNMYDEYYDEPRSTAEIIEDMDDEQKEAVLDLVNAIQGQYENDYDEDDYDDEYDEDDYDDDNYDEDDYDDYDEDDYDDYDEGEDMKHNAFDEESYGYGNGELMHAALEEAFKNAETYGSLKKAVEIQMSEFDDFDDVYLAHDAVESTADLPDTYGIKGINWLEPDPHDIYDKPQWINIHPLGWVDKVINGVHHTPFAKIRMMFADITADEARAKGYIKGHMKKEEVISLLKRSIAPTTIYKKQKFDRDDLIDASFDVVPWIKAEMKQKLKEEKARAYIFGDGRQASDEDKVDETKIIPIVKDEDLFAIKHEVTLEANESLEHALIRHAVLGQDDYQGSGNTTAFLEQKQVTRMLLMEDQFGHRLYKNLTDLASAMGVNEIVKVPASMIPAGIYGVIVDLADYSVGQKDAGKQSMFDDFDIDYNRQKYLIEERQSAALTRPYSAVVLKVAANG